MKLCVLVFFAVVSGLDIAKVKKPWCLELWEKCMGTPNVHRTAAQCDDIVLKKSNCPKPKPYNRARIGDYDYVIVREKTDKIHLEDVNKLKDNAKQADQQYQANIDTGSRSHSRYEDYDDNYRQDNRDNNNRMRNYDNPDNTRYENNPDNRPYDNLDNRHNNDNKAKQIYDNQNQKSTKLATAQDVSFEKDTLHKLDKLSHKKEEKYTQ